MNQSKVSPLGISDKQIDVFYSTVIFDAGASVGNEIVFFPNSGYSEVYQNLQLPTPSDQDIWIHGVRIDHCMQFDDGALTGKEREFAHFFEQFSRLTWKHGKKGYATIPMNFTQPYDAFLSNATVTNRSKFSDFLPLGKDAIFIPANSRFEMKLLLPTALTTAATGLAYLPGAPSSFSLTSDLGFYVRLSLWCTSKEPVR